MLFRAFSFRGGNWTTFVRDFFFEILIAVDVNTPIRNLRRLSRDLAFQSYKPTWLKRSSPLTTRVSHPYVACHRYLSFCFPRGKYSVTLKGKRRKKNWRKKIEIKRNIRPSWKGAGFRRELLRDPVKSFANPCKFRFFHRIFFISPQSYWCFLAFFFFFFFLEDFKPRKTYNFTHPTFLHFD